MSNRQDKEQLIYHAIVNLIENGHDYQQLKMVDIAKAADIGKATIYEYFTSKDELLSKTIVFHIDELFNKLSVQMKLENSFESCLKLTIESISSKFSELCLFSTGLVQSSHNGELKDKIQMIYLSLIDILVQIGKKDGSINPKLDDEFVYYAIASSIGAYFFIQCRNEKSCAQLHYTINMIVKTLQ